MDFDINHLYLTTEGRIGRRTFWMGIIGLFVVSVVLSVIIGAIFGWLSFATRLLEFIVQLVLAYPAYALMAKRFQDRNRPATYAAVIVVINILYSLIALIGLSGAPGHMNPFGWVVSIVVAIIGIWILIELGFLRGTVGANTYGPDPLPA